MTNNVIISIQFIFPTVKEKKESEVTQSCRTLCEPMDCSLQASSVHGIFQARILEWVAISAGKESACSAGDLGSIPGLGRSPGEGKGYPLQYSGLENFMDCIIHGVAKSWTQLSDFHFSRVRT